MNGYVTRYLAFGNLWRRLSVNLYGMGFHNHQRRKSGLSYGPAGSPSTQAVTAPSTEQVERLLQPSVYPCTNAVRVRFSIWGG